MCLTNLRHWHWALIGLALGLLLAYLQGLIEPPPVRSMGQQNFETMLGQAPEHGHAALTNLVVHPPDGDHCLVTGDRLVVMQTQLAYVPFRFASPVPYRPVAANKDHPAIRHYLDALCASGQPISYRYAWWSGPRMRWVLWTGGSLLLVGGLWPLLLRWPMGAGWGPQPKAQPYDLSRFGSEPAPPKQEASPGPAVVADAPMPIQPAAEPAEPPAASPVKQLSASPLQPAPPAEPHPEKDYAGEFYPTEAHVPAAAHARGRAQPASSPPPKQAP